MADNLETHRVLTITKIATVAVAAYRLVILSTNREGVEYPGAQYATGVIGVTLHAAAIGKPVEIGVIGIFPVQVDGAAVAIAIGDAIGCHDNTGYGQDVIGAASRPYFATAQEASTADGDVIMATFCGCRMLTTA